MVETGGGGDPGGGGGDPGGGDGRCMRVDAGGGGGGMMAYHDRA